MRFVGAIAISVGIHAVLAVALGLAIEKSPVRMKLAELDLSSVDLSFAETVEEKAPVLSAPSVPVAPSPPPQPKFEEKPPEQKIEKSDAPDPLAPKFPEPVEEPSQLIPHHSSFITPQLAAPRQARIDAPPRPKRAIRPEYPKRARERGEQGDVILSLSVTAEGSVSSVSVAVSSGFPELDEAAVRAAKAARFTPARLKDDPVASTARLTLSFRLK